MCIDCCCPNPQLIWQCTHSLCMGLVCVRVYIRLFVRSFTHSFAHLSFCVRMCVCVYKSNMSVSVCVYVSQYRSVLVLVKMNLWVCMSTIDCFVSFDEMRRYFFSFFLKTINYFLAGDVCFQKTASSVAKIWFVFTCKICFRNYTFDDTLRRRVNSTQKRNWQQQMCVCVCVKWQTTAAANEQQQQQNSREIILYFKLK